MSIWGWRRLLELTTLVCTTSMRQVSRTENSQEISEADLSDNTFRNNSL